MTAKSELAWSLGRSGSPGEEPEEYFPASVPGAVQLDYARAMGLPDYKAGKNVELYRPLEECYWHYSAMAEAAPGGGEAAFLVLEGVDYRFDVFIDGRLRASCEGMNQRVRLLLCEGPGRKRFAIKVMIHPAPKRPGYTDDRRAASASCKPAVGYGWDWHPRLIPLGIFDEAYVEILPVLHIAAFDPSYRLSEGLDRAAIRADYSLSAAGTEGQSLLLACLDGTGAITASASGPIAGDSGSIGLELARPRLWWPNGQGDQPLYRLRLSLLGADGKEIHALERSIGFRRIRLVMNQGAWDEPADFPKSRSVPPCTVEINGRRIFAKGSNWVPPDIFPGKISAASYRPLVEAARDANMNVFIAWGGGMVSKEAFFDLCDKAGIMVFQEFTLACNPYPDDDGYLEVLEREATAILKRLRAHPCLAAWVGGNELFNSWSLMDDQSHALRLLGKLCYELDRFTPFLPSSPLMGMSNGHYVFTYEDGRDVLHHFNAARSTAFGEFGCSSISKPDYIATFLDEEERRDCRPGTAWETHHGFNMWAPEDCWLRFSEIERYFGPQTRAWDNFARLSELSDILQSEAYRHMFEAARRKWPYCSLALNWCFNEPWPSVAGNNLVNWPCLPKPALAAVKGALRDSMLSLSFDSFLWKPGETFTADLWLLNDSPESIAPGLARVIITIDGREEELAAWKFPETPPRTHSHGPSTRLVLPNCADRSCRIRAIAEGRTELDSSYLFLVGEATPGKEKKEGLTNI